MIYEFGDIDFSVRHIAEMQSQNFPHRISVRALPQHCYIATRISRPLVIDVDDTPARATRTGITGCAAPASVGLRPLEEHADNALPDTVGKCPDS